MERVTDGERDDTATGRAEVAEQPADLDRFKAFTDAVVAIALTLLVFPLLEGVSDVVGRHAPAAEWLAKSGGPLAFLALSFLLISSYWGVHERIYRHATRLSRTLVAANVVWMFSIVLMPVTTALLSAAIDAAQVSLYVGAIVVCAGSLAVQAWCVGRAADSTLPTRTMAGALAMTGTSGLALVLGLVTLPFLSTEHGGLTYFWLLLMSFSGVVARRLRPLARRVLGRSAADGR